MVPVFSWLSRKFNLLRSNRNNANVVDSIIYSYFEIAAKEGDMAGLKGMVMG